MSLEMTFRCICDAQECGVGGPISLRGVPDACQKAKKSGWIEVKIHSCGIGLTFCEECAPVIQTCVICEKKTFDPRANHCGCCNSKDNT